MGMPLVSPSNGLAREASHIASVTRASQPATDQTVEIGAASTHLSPSLTSNPTVQPGAVSDLDSHCDPFQTPRQGQPGEMLCAPRGLSGDLEKGQDVDDDSSSCCSEQHVDFMGGFSTDSAFDPKRDV